MSKKSRDRSGYRRLAPQRRQAAQRANREAQARLRALPEAERSRRFVLFAWEPTDRLRLCHSFTAEGEPAPVMTRIAKYVTPRGRTALVWVPEGSEPAPKMTRKDFTALVKCQLAEEVDPDDFTSSREWRNHYSVFVDSITQIEFEEVDQTADGEPIGVVRYVQGEHVVPDEQGPGWKTLSQAQEMAASAGVPLRVVGKR